MGKLIIVSNRLPVSVRRKKDTLNFTVSVGGLATGLGSIYKRYGGLWIGWPGIIPKEDNERKELTEKLAEIDCHPVFINKYDFENYYYGFSNRVLWPLFHYFLQHVVYNQAYWKVYKRVNSLFCEEILKVAEPEDIIWVHDYHLMLLPKMLREKIPDGNIGFFLHIPFPSTEVFRLLPWRQEILEGILGADLVGFHTYEYVRHFLSSTLYLLGYEHEMGWINLEDRRVRVDAFPMGVNFQEIQRALENSEVNEEFLRLRRRIGERKVVFSLSRLDYTKGILETLEAYEHFLSSNSQWYGKIVFILLCTPSRSILPSYHLLKRRIDEMVGRINGRFGFPGWTPLLYLYKLIPFKLLAAFYRLADVAVVTPLRDGMNLVAKEFVASKDGSGVLILSELAGASKELEEAIIVNPNDREELAQALKEALTMSKEEQFAKISIMQERLRRYDVSRWVKDFLEKLSESRQTQVEYKTKKLSFQVEREIISDYVESQSRLLLLDYDGTLIPFADKPEKASPDRELLQLLLKSARQSCTVLISGRDRKTLSRWFSNKLNLVAEHGAWIKELGEPWSKIEELSADWKEQLRPIFELFMDRVPGSFVEEKDFSMVWHYRKADPIWGAIRANELADILRTLTASTELQVFQGSKTIEIKNAKVSKGRAALYWLSKTSWDFILAMGDDWTDEETFKVLPERAYTIKIGFTPSRARFYLKSPQEARRLLKMMSESQTAKIQHANTI